MKNVKHELYEYLRRDDLTQAAFLPGRVGDLKFDPQPYIQKILDQCSVAWGRLEGRTTALDTIQSINQQLFGELGLPGKTAAYKKVMDDADQFYLHKLLTQKSGAPVTYAVLYTIFAQQLGLYCECLSFPSKFFLRIKEEDTEIYVNPFEQGRIMTESEFQHQFQAAMQQNKLMSANLYQVLCFEKLMAKLMQQLKHVYVLKSEPLKALRCVELLTVIYPDSAELTRDRGILYCEMEYFSKAKADLKRYLHLKPEADDVKEIRKLASMLNGYRETMN